jgi:hypothetical protein
MLCSYIAIDRNLRNFTKEVANSLEEVKWSSSGLFQRTQITNRSALEHLLVSHKNYQQKNCTSYTNQFIHFIKCSNNLLHTVDNLRERNNAYDEMLCPSCAEVEESLSHLVICKEMEQGFNSIEREVTEKKIYYLLFYLGKDYFRI